MKIPNEFKLGKRKYWVFKMGKSRRGLQGSILYGTRRIEVNVPGQTDMQIAETFWHEVTHAILEDMKDEDCGKPHWTNERFVTAFSERLNEVVHSAKFGENKNATR